MPPSETLDRTSESVTHIRPPEGLWYFNLSELWEYRQLLYFLTWRNIKVRYKETILGIAWAILQPLAMMIVFTLFFNKMAKITSEGVPYPIFSYAALLAWQVLSNGITKSSNSLVADQTIISRVYFPRIIIPLSTVLAAMVDLMVASGLLAVMMVFYGVMPSLNLIWLPFFVILMVMTSSGIGFWLSALNLEYRDVQQLLPFLNRFLLFLSPVVYPTSMVPEPWRFFYTMNPIVSVIDGFRWSLFGTGDVFRLPYLVSMLLAGVIFFSGAVFFRWREQSFVDVVG